MKKIKWTILGFAILFSIGSAFATRPHALLTGLYYYNGSGYMPAGTEGLNYVCESSPDVCTYTLNNGVYTPYQTAGSYTPIEVAPTTKPVQTKGR